MKRLVTNLMRLFSLGLLSACRAANSSWSWDKLADQNLLMSNENTTLAGHDVQAIVLHSNFKETKFNLVFFFL